MSKKYEIFLFDLDGTISDLCSFGITNSVMYALKSSASKRQTGQNYINLSVRQAYRVLLRDFTVLQRAESGWSKVLPGILS